MRKVLALTVSMVVMASMASGEIYVNFQTPSDSLWTHDGGGGTVALPAAQTFAVYWSSTDSNAGFDPSSPLNPTSGEFLGAYNTSPGPQIAGRISGSANNIYFGSGTTDYSPGYVYIAVFELAYSTYESNGNQIPVGTYYGLSAAGGATASTSLTQQYPTPTTPDQYGGQITSLSTTSLTTVPEPGSMALMLLGAAVVGVRRFRKRS